MFRKGLWVLGLIAVGIGLAADVVLADFQWVIQDTGVRGACQASLGLRNGVWPTVAYSDMDWVGVVSLTPVGWQSLDLGPGAFPEMAAGPNGELAFSYISGEMPSTVMVAELGRYGWTSSMVASQWYRPREDPRWFTPDVAFTPDGGPSVVHLDDEYHSLVVSTRHGGAWRHDYVAPRGIRIPSANYVLACDSLDQTLVVFFEEGLMATQKGMLIHGGWSEPFPVVEDGVFALQAAFDENDVPGVVFEQDGMLGFATFDIAQGQWQRTLISTKWDGTQVGFAFDSQNHPGIAYSTGYQEQLRFAYFDGLTWNDTIVYPGVYSTWVSLAFDRNDKPVISFVTHGIDKRLLVAYDPAAVPEPAVATLLLGAGSLAVWVGRGRQPDEPGRKRRRRD